MGNIKLLIFVGFLLGYINASVAQGDRPNINYKFKTYWDSTNCNTIMEKWLNKKENKTISVYNSDDSLLQKYSIIDPIEYRKLLKNTYKTELTLKYQKYSSYEFLNPKGQLICQTIMMKHAPGDVDRYIKKWYDNNQLKIYGVEKNGKFKVKRWRMDGSLISCARLGYFEYKGLQQVHEHGWQKIWYPSGKIKYKILYDRNHVTQLMFFDERGRLKKRKTFLKEEAIYLSNLLEDKEHINLLYLAKSCIDKCEEPSIDAYIYTIKAK
jgi:antitoxin component YwqK of YwqJK toxin-antitoxin module